MGTTTDKLNKLIETKAAIKTAITNKGVEVSDSDTFASYAGKIDAISTSGSGSNLGFEDIGYNSTPDYIVDGLTIGKQAYDNFNPNASNWNDAFGEDFDVNTLIFFPKVSLNEDNSLWHNATFISGDTTNYGDLQIIPDFEFGSMTVNKLNYPYLTSVHFNGTLNMGTQGTFNSCKSLKDVYIKEFNIDGKNISRIFSECYNLESVDVTFVGKPTNTQAAFQYVAHNRWISPIEKSPYIDFSEVNDVSSTFQYSHFLEISEMNSIKATNFYLCFGYSEDTIKIGKVDFSSATSITNAFVGLGSLKFLLITNLGKSNLTNYNFSSLYVWGKEDIAISLSTGATQALKDSLITNSFDRATAGYPVCTISLSTDTKALLSESEIAQITAKGFTIA